MIMSVSNVDSSSIKKPLRADYLVVGAGAAGMSFVDTLLTESSSATVIVADRRDRPGGHWTVAYPHARLHQPSCFYGVNSLPLGGSLDRWGRERYDLEDRASAEEILEYYMRVADRFARSGRVRLFLGWEHSEDEDGDHRLTDPSGGRVRRVACGKVVVARSNVVVPSMRDGPPFPVDPGARVAPPNDLPERLRSGEHSKFIVIGAGRTGSDSVAYLLRNGVDQSAITWIVSRDVWFFVRDGYIKPGLSYWQCVSRVLKPLVAAVSVMDAFRAFEEDGMVGRLDSCGSQPRPEVFKGAQLSRDELDLLRSVDDVVRMGRVTSIARDAIVLERGEVPLSSGDLIVDCMANFGDDGDDFYGQCLPRGFRVFEGRRISLGALPFVWNPCLSAAVAAFLEARMEDDRVKNDMLYFPTDGFEHTPANFFSMFYAQFKTIKALGGYAPAALFYLKSRLSVDSPWHHGGLLPMLWAAFGPLGLSRDGDRFAEKYEGGGYMDARTFGCDRPPPDRRSIRAAVRRTGGKKTRAAKYPPPNSLSSTGLFGFWRKDSTVNRLLLVGCGAFLSLAVSKMTCQLARPRHV